MDIEQLIATSIVVLFGSLLLWGAVAAMINRVVGSHWGLATGLVLFGLTGLVLAAHLAWRIHGEHTDLSLRREHCEAVAPIEGGSAERSRDVFRWTAPNGQALRIHLEHRDGCASRRDDQATRLRLRDADIAAGRDPLPAQWIADPRRDTMLIGFFAAFGGFWFLAGLVSLAGRIEDRLPRREPLPLSSARKRWATTMVVSGNLTLLGCFAIAAFADWDGERATAFAFRAVPVACACYAVAALIKRQLRASGALILFVLGGGFWLAAASLKLMAG